MDLKNQTSQSLRDTTSPSTQSTLSSQITDVIFDERSLIQSSIDYDDVSSLKQVLMTGSEQSNVCKVKPQQLVQGQGPTSVGSIVGQAPPPSTSPAVHQQMVCTFSRIVSFETFLKFQSVCFRISTKSRKTGFLDCFGADLILCFCHQSIPIFFLHFNAYQIIKNHSLVRLII